jgi:hypothetical protein
MYLQLATFTLRKEVFEDANSVIWRLDSMSSDFVVSVDFIIVSALFTMTSQDEMKALEDFSEKGVTLKVLSPKK